MFVWKINSFCTNVELVDRQTDTTLTDEWRRSVYLHSALTVSVRRRLVWPLSRWPQTLCHVSSLAIWCGCSSSVGLLSVAACVHRLPGARRCRPTVDTAGDKPLIANWCGYCCWRSRLLLVRSSLKRWPLGVNCLNHTRIYMSASIRTGLQSLIAVYSLGTGALHTA